MRTESGQVVAASDFRLARRAADLHRTVAELLELVSGKERESRGRNERKGRASERERDSERGRFSREENEGKVGRDEARERNTGRSRHSL